MRITFLGTGTSHGVPKVGCSCPVCVSEDEKNKRYRSSILIEHDGYRYVVDTGPEFRLQMIRAHITHLDGVLYTHCHADHINGIDDLRVFCAEGPLDVYGSEAVIDTLNTRFAYAVGKNPYRGGLPQLHAHVIPREGLNLAGVHCIPVPVIHGCKSIYGYRIGPFAYLTDCKTIPEESYALLEGLEVVVLDTLRYESHPTHMNVAEAVAAAQRIGAGRTYLTHISHRLEHNTFDADLPENIHPAYDMMMLDFPQVQGKSP